MENDATGEVVPMPTLPLLATIKSSPVVEPMENKLVLPAALMENKDVGIVVPIPTLPDVCCTKN